MTTVVGKGLMDRTDCDLNLDLTLNATDVFEPTLAQTHCSLSFSQCWGQGTQ